VSERFIENAFCVNGIIHVHLTVLTSLSYCHWLSGAVFWWQEEFSELVDSNSWGTFSVYRRGL